MRRKWTRQNYHFDGIEQVFGLSSLFSYMGGVDVLQKAVVRRAYLNVAKQGGR